MKTPFLSAIAVMMLFVCFAGNPANAEAQCHVYVSIPPQSHFVKAIGGEHVEIQVMVPSEKSPASYEPSPKQMVRLAGAELYFAIGVPFETAWLDKFTDANPEMRIIHTAAGIEKKPINRRNASTSGHLAKCGIKDPHIWLSPPLVMLQARHILTALMRVDPGNAADYGKNYASFINRLVELDIALTKEFADISNACFMVCHPSWGYFADAYGLEQIAIEINGKAPKAKDVSRLIRNAEQRGIHTIFVQPQFCTKQARIIAKEIGGRVVEADPLAEDWEQNLRDVASAIEQELKRSP